MIISLKKKGRKCISLSAFHRCGCCWIVPFSRSLFVFGLIWSVPKLIVAVSHSLVKREGIIKTKTGRCSLFCFSKSLPASETRTSSTVLFFYHSTVDVTSWTTWKKFFLCVCALVCASQCFVPFKRIYTPFFFTLTPPGPKIDFEKWCRSRHDDVRFFLFFRLFDFVLFLSFQDAIPGFFSPQHFSHFYGWKMRWQILAESCGVSEGWTLLSRLPEFEPFCRL